MPTPALRATASRLASGPPALNTVLAASSTRSRLRCASARGLRELFAERTSIPNSRHRLLNGRPLINGGTLRINKCRYTQPTSHGLRRRPLGNRSDPEAGDLCPLRFTIASIGTLHEFVS